MRLISLVLLSFIATNTVAIYIPKVYPAVESLTPDSSEEAVESPIPIPPKEGDIIGHIKFLTKTIEEAMVMEQKAKDQAKKSHTTSDKATTDSSSNSGSDESENDPELLIEIAQEASPSPLMAKIYATQIRNVGESSHL
ncbi:hypothetical protein BASA82_000404 [Batrachochytrium salamandrivorans]|nr:hypothetical protein BASA82_000404 [Batrachochytrium salamandrivorans]